MSAAGLHDAKPQSQLKVPDPTPSDLALKARAVEYAQAKEDLDGPVGPETSAKTSRFRAAAQALAAAALAFAMEITK